MQRLFGLLLVRKVLASHGIKNLSKAESYCYDKEFQRGRNMPPGPTK
jgi:hypothetical protein